jgi:glucose/arabinose dehydrogenase
VLEPARLAVIVALLLAFISPAAGIVGAQTPDITIELEPVATGFAKPTQIANAGDGSDRLFIVKKPSVITILRDGKALAAPFLDINRLVKTAGNEQGLLGLAFHPDYGTNGLFFVDYTDNQGDVTVARYRVSGDDPDRADPASGQILLVVDKPYDDHNGGMLAFGPDGYLYIGVGDGGAPAEPLRNAQRTTTMMGKVLRIDVDHATHGRNYAIPTDNPYVDDALSAPEIWAMGLRNPWRFSFDRETGDLFIADVGLWASEEVNIQPADAAGGRNYGWNIIEGEICHDLEREDRCGSARLTAPVFIYHHEMGCAIVGGYVYRGAAIPELRGRYLFGDYCMGRIWVMSETDGAWSAPTPIETGLNISTFGEDESGELYVADLNGAIYRIVTG